MFTGIGQEGGKNMGETQTAFAALRSQGGRDGVGSGTSGCLPGLPQNGIPCPNTAELVVSSFPGEVFKWLMPLINTAWDLGRWQYPKGLSVGFRHLTGLGASENPAKLLTSCWQCDVRDPSPAHIPGARAHGMQWYKQGQFSLYPNLTPCCR